MEGEDHGECKVARSHAEELSNDSVINICFLCATNGLCCHSLDNFHIALRGAPMQIDDAL